MTTSKPSQSERIDLGPNGLLDLTLILERTLLSEFQETVGKLQLSVETVTVELIRLFVRQSPAMDRRGVPLVGFLNLGRVSLGEAPPEAPTALETRSGVLPRRPAPKKRTSLPTPAEIAAACDEIRRGREVVK